ncbi:MAG: putative transporter [Alloprevotella sp.]|nr:putative transporter [Alloprevotella sp.]
MDWITSILYAPAGPAYLAMAFALVIWLGVKLGKVKIGGIALGVTFVLFVGILVGHLYNTLVVEPQVAADPAFADSIKAQNQIINFVKELGLILFVYCIGLQVGPGFFATFKKGGVPMNTLSVGMILLNVAVMLGLFFLWFYDSGGTQGENAYNLAMMVGVMYGAVTNTPGLGAANNVLPSLGEHFDQLPALGNGYACAYPLGVVGIIGATILIRYLCKISLQRETEQIEREQEADPAAVPHHIYIKVTNRGIFGKTLKELHTFLKRDFVCSRCKVNEEMFIPNGETRLEEGMKLLLVCAEADMEPVVTLIGERINESWRKEINESTKYISRRLVVTNPEVNGKTFNDLHFSTLFNVNVTRVTRNGMTMFASRGFRLQMGDRLLMTGTEENVDRVKKIVGNEIKHLEHPNIGMVFLGILIGVLVGQIPIPIPGVEVPVKLGLAGGPLVVAILIGAFGYKMNITAYTTTSANLMVREIGLALFLAGVGIQAGATFWDTVVNGGYHYVWMGFLITIIPILIGGVIGRWRLKLNYYTLMGLIAGTYTDPPALAFASQTAGNDAPAIGYSTVYPLSMFMRILVAQLTLLLIIPLL